MSEYTRPELSDFRDSWACEHARADIPVEDRRAEFDRMVAGLERAAAAWALEDAADELRVDVGDYGWCMALRARAETFRREEA